MNSFAEIRTYERKLARHIHDFSQVIVPLRGVLDINIEGSFNRVLPNSTIFVSTRAVHEFESSQDSEILVFDISEDNDVDKFLSEKNSARRALTPAMWRCLQYIANEARLDENKLIQSRALIAVAMNILTSPEDDASSSAHPNPNLETAYNRLQRDFSKTLRIEAVAREAGYSESSFLRKFRTAFGQTPKEIQIEARMRRSVELLLTTGATISSIAYELGYENESSFFNAFKRRYDVTPRAFRMTKK